MESDIGQQTRPAEGMPLLQRLRDRWVAWRAEQIDRGAYLLARAVAWTTTRLWQVSADWRSVRPVISRFSAHLAVLMLAVGVILFSGLNLPLQKPLAAALPAVEPNAVGGSNVKMASIAPTPTPAPTPQIITFRSEPTSLVRIAEPRTVIPKRPRRGVITYTVQPGDTVQSIASAFDLQPTTLMWSNEDLRDVPDLLRIGQQLAILPVDGVYHTVEEGDTLESIAEKYKVDVEAITSLSYNNLHPPLYRIQPGMKLIIPGGTKPYVPKRVTHYTGPVPEGVNGTGAFQWPVLGVITQGYWWGHRAIDIGAPVGSAVLASDSGFVSFVGWTNKGYGYLIIIDHANGYKTYYAHLSQMYVTLGQKVERGQVIGAVGSTGNSTGPHLHFEIRYNGVLQNPLAWLP